MNSNFPPSQFRLEMIFYLMIRLINAEKGPFCFLEFISFVLHSFFWKRTAIDFFCWDSFLSIYQTHIFADLTKIILIMKLIFINEQIMLTKEKAKNNSK